MSRRDVMLAMVGAALISIAAVGLYRGHSSSGPHSDRERACAEWRSSISYILKSPATAQFEACDEAQVVPENMKDTGLTGRWLVLGHVDAQNSFGALLRDDYFAIVGPGEGGRWTTYTVRESRASDITLIVDSILGRATPTPTPTPTPKPPYEYTPVPLPR